MIAFKIIGKICPETQLSYACYVLVSLSLISSSICTYLKHTKPKTLLMTPKRKSVFFSALAMNTESYGGILLLRSVCQLWTVADNLLLLHLPGHDRLDGAAINSAFMELESWSDPTSTTALYARPVKVAQACITVCTKQLALQCTFFNCGQKQASGYLLQYELISDCI